MRFRSVTSTTTALVASLSISLAALAAAPSVAHADDEDPAAARVPLVPMPAPEGSAADAPPTTRVFYGWQNLGADAASIALFGVTLDAEDGTAAGVLAYASVGGYLFGSPLVHALHGHTKRALGSFAMRLGVPLALGGITWAVEDHEDCTGKENTFCGFGEGIVPVFVGMLGAGAVMLVDDFGLAYDEKPVGPTWTPTVAASHGGMTFGFAGTF